MEIDEDMIRGSARSQLVAAQDLGHGVDDALEIVGGDDHLIGQDARRVLKISQHAWAMKPATMIAATGSSSG